MRREIFAEAQPAPQPQRGGAPVGRMHELPEMELAAIVFLRAWCGDAEERQMIRRDLHSVLNPRDALLAEQRFATLMRLVLAQARSPIMHHHLDCACYGGHESAFAQMIAATAGRDRDEALLFAATLVVGPAAHEAVLQAEDLAPAFLALARAGRAEPVPQGATRH